MNAWLRTGKGCANQAHRGCYVSFDIQFRLPGLLKNESLQQGKHDSRDGIDVQASGQLSSTLSIAKSDSKTITLSYAPLGDLPYSSIKQRLGAELNGDCATLPF